MGNRSAKTVSLILAGGRGSRMLAPNMAKVCQPIGNRPAILHVIDSLEQAGINQHIIVVGHHAEQVMKTVAAAYPGCIFCFQPEQLGTGNAAKCGAAVLQKLAFSGEVLVIVGDRLVRPHVLQKMLETAERTKSDLTFLVGDKEIEPAAGRVVNTLEGTPEASIERFDSARSRLLANFFAHTDRGGVLEAGRALAMARDFFGGEYKLEVAIGELYKHLQAGVALNRELLSQYFRPEDRLITLRSGRQITGAEVERSKFVNLSVYLFHAAALYRALAGIERNNALQEEYLTDAIEILATQRAKLTTVSLDRPLDSMSFNTREDLSRIEETFFSDTEQKTAAPPAPEGHQDPGELPPVVPRAAAPQVSAVLKFLRTDRSAGAWYQQEYGVPSSAVELRLAFLQNCLMFFRAQFGEGEVYVHRAPGRVNLMGRHIDHQGGLCHGLALPREIVVLARPRADRKVHLQNLEAELYPPREFSLDEFDEALRAHKWDDFIVGKFVRTGLQATPGDWSHYVRGVLLRLQKEVPEHSLCGMDLAIGSTLPSGGGLSSSSALVVAVAQTACKLNGLALSPEQLITLCMEGERFVGTKSGGGDHAAILLAQPGRLISSDFRAGTYRATLEWPENLAILICDSGVRAEKSAQAQAIYNQRVVCYALGVQLFRAQHIDLAERIQSLRDLLPGHLEISLSELFQRLKVVPEKLRGFEIAEKIDVDWERLLPADPEAQNRLYPLRDILLYGISECARSEQLPALLQQAHYERVGALLSISHDGDRVSAASLRGRIPYRLHYPDEKLDELAQLAAAGDHAAALHLQPGYYGCSIVEVDTLVDLLKGMNGVLGAQILGAGLGGFMMALVEYDRLSQVMRRVQEAFYGPRRLRPRMFWCRPCRGSGQIDFPAGA